MPNMKEARLIAARMTHDLSAPASAVGMGFSVLQQSPEDQQALHITSQSIHSLQATLNFLRALFGAEELPAWSHMNRILHIYAQARDTKLIYREDHSPPKEWAEPLPFLCLIGMDAVSGSKNLSIQWDEHSLTVTAQGVSCVMPPQTLDALGATQDIRAFTPSSVHIYVLNKILERHGLNIQKTFQPHTLELKAYTAKPLYGQTSSAMR